MKLQDRFDQDGVAVWLNHQGCPNVVYEHNGGMWPLMKPIPASHYDWQDTYACPECDLRIVVSLVGK